jgi:acid phosphatase type 7
MSRKLLLFGVLLPSCLLIFAQAPQGFRVTHGPWLQNATSDGITIMWTTNAPTVPGVLISDDAINYRLVQNSTDGMIDAGDTLHKIRVSGLKPATRYFYKTYSRSIDKFEPYKISYSDTIIGQQESFVTIDREADNLNFIVLNDVHENGEKMAGYIRNKSIAKPDLWFFNGDMIDYLQKPNQVFTGFLDTAVHYFAKSTPFIYVRGNHEARGMLARQFKDYFDFNGERFFGSYKIGPVYFLVLDCGEDKPDDNQYYYQLADYDNYRLHQLEWLKEEVRRKEFLEASFRVVLIHMPVQKATDQWHGMQFLSDHFGPVLGSSHIDLMLSGHTHKFAVLSVEQSGFGYPIIVSSNNSFIEVEADHASLVINVRDISGIEIHRSVIIKK